MAVTFNQVPANALVPFTYVEIDPSRAGSIGAAFRSLLIGQRLASGTVAAGVPTPVGSAADASREVRCRVHARDYGRSVPPAESDGPALGAGA